MKESKQHGVFIAGASIVSALIIGYCSLVAAGILDLPFGSSGNEQTLQNTTPPTPQVEPNNDESGTGKKPDLITENSSDIINLSAVTNTTPDVITVHLLKADGSWKQYMLKPKETYHMGVQNIPVTIRWTDKLGEQKATLRSKSFTPPPPADPRYNEARYTFRVGEGGRAILQFEGM